jgi:iron complex outermembrane recepter protein
MLSGKNWLKIFFIVIIVLQANYTFAQQGDSLTVSELKNMSLEQLMNIEVTSVSKHPEKLEEAASAIQVITQEDIRNSGAKTLPEALRLASNLQVAQVNSSQWAISARGFNNVLANKLLVLIDGRTVYTPLYAGVFWDVQNVMLEDVDRIEVISGPGGTLWGSNAVNGIINIITKSSKDTKGLFAEAAAGSNLPAMGSVRYGGQIGSKIFYRAYGTGYKLGNTLLTNGKEADDNWGMGQGGFRMDWDATEKDKVIFEGNIYHATPNPAGGDTSSIATGDNLLARWNHSTPDKSDFQLQAYYDHTRRHFDNGLVEDLKTYDVEWQSRYYLGQRNEFTYGLDFRAMDHNVNNLPLFGFFPAHKMLYMYSGFIQDKIWLIKERLNLTIGTKLEHNTYTGFENQPNVRVAWVPAQNQTLWAAVSRAVRTPARIDRDFNLFAAPGVPVVSGNDSFAAAKMTAYELGWRLQPLKALSVSLSTFYNIYDGIRSVEQLNPPHAIPLIFANGVKGESYGIELAVTTQLAWWWNLKGGYTFFTKNLSIKPGHQDANHASGESNDPENQVVIQANIKLSAPIELGTIIRYIDKLPNPYVPSYFGVDLRIGWKINKAIEVNMVGQNLLKKEHQEFIPSSPSAREIQRSVYGKVSFRF